MTPSSGEGIERQASIYNLLAIPVVWTATLHALGLGRPRERPTAADFQSG